LLRHAFSKEPTMTATQHDKAARLQELHRRPGAFVIANAWDAGSARVLAGLGFEAIATSSGASANTFGRLDGNVTREEALGQARSICGAIDAPVSGDLEKGFGDAPEDAAETIRLAAAAGLVGGSIEDATGDPRKPLYDIGHATERIAAAAQAAHSLPFPFMLTARSENFLRGNPDLDDTIKRLQAFEKAGADVLFAPCLPDLAAVRAVCQAVSKPVNFMIGVPRCSFSVAELEEAGVKRISLATSLYRAAMAGLVEAASEAIKQRTFTFVDRLPPSSQYQQFMQR
jgi:2-methylisocitrate lyase-like PEP mutase family enzyme